MTVYKYFVKIVMKHKLVILAYTMMFLVLSVINGNSSESQEAQFLQSRLEIGLVDNANSDLSNGLISYLEEKNNITTIKEDEDYIKEQIFLQTLDAVIIIPEDFNDKVINRKQSLKVYKDDRKTEAAYLEQQVEKYLIFANATYNYNGGNFDLGKLSLALGEEANVEIVRSNKGNVNNDANKWFKTYYNFTSYIIIAVYVTVIGLVMIDFKDKKIERRMRVSSKRYLSFNKEIYLGQISLGAFITLIFILGSIVFKGKYIKDIYFSKYVINIMVFSFASLCFAFLISNLTRNKLIINGVSTVVSLGVSFISGVMVPQELLSHKVLSIAKFFPSYYFVTINERNIYSLMDIRYEILMQIMFGIVFLLLGLRTRYSTY